MWSLSNNVFIFIHTQKLREILFSLYFGFGMNIKNLFRKASPQNKTLFIGWQVVSVLDNSIPPLRHAIFINF